MIKVEKVQIDNGQSTVINFTLGVEEARLLDSIMDKLLNEPYNDEEIRLDIDEQIFLTNFARHIGTSGVRQYIDSAIINKAEIVYDEVMVDNNWQHECLSAFEVAKENKKYNKDSNQL